MFDIDLHLYCCESVMLGAGLITDNNAIQCWAGGTMGFFWNLTILLVPRTAFTSSIVNEASMTQSFTIKTKLLGN